MKLAYQKALIFVAAGIVYLAGQYFRGMWFVNSGLVNFCQSYMENGKMYCNSPLINTLGWPLILAGEYLAVVALIMLFANAAALRRFLWLSLFYIPIALGLTLWIYPIHTPLGGLATYAQGVRLFGSLYILVTVILVLWSAWQSKRGV